MRYATVRPFVPVPLRRCRPGGFRARLRPGPVGGGGRDGRLADGEGRGTGDQTVSRATTAFTAT